MAGWRSSSAAEPSRESPQLGPFGENGGAARRGVTGTGLLLLLLLLLASTIDKGELLIIIDSKSIENVLSTLLRA